MNYEKCVCGYEYEETWDTHEKVITKGDKPFRILRGHGLTFERNGGNGENPNPYNDARLFRPALLLVCPKCGTIKAIED